MSLSNGGGAHSTSHSHGAKNAGPQFGKPLDFRGLRRAPINEQGVVYLFGIISSTWA